MTITAVEKDKEISEPFSFLPDGGEMGRLTREFDWAATALGDPDTWPQSLQTTLNIILHSRFPMFLWWGTELIQFYNDAYRPSLGKEGKHPMALGQRGPECWPEIWDTIFPLISQVRDTGISTWSENQLVPIFRDGKLEDVYWTFSYSPVYCNKETTGVLVICTETTQLVQRFQKMEQRELNLRNMIIQAPVAMSILKGPEYIVQIANERMYEIWGKTKEELINKPIFDGLPEARNQGFEEKLWGVMQSGNTFEAYGIPVMLPRKEGLEEVFLHLVYEAYHEEDGTISGIMVVAIDVTQPVLEKQSIENMIRQRTKELEDSNLKLLNVNAELVRSNGNLEEFAYVASHDMKEPVRKIGIFAERLQQQNAEGLTSKNDYFVEKIQSASARLAMLIEDMLHYSRVNQTPLEKEIIDINNLLAVILEDNLIEIEQKKAVITLSDFPDMLGYRQQLHQAIQNLVQNALKFSAQGEAPVIKIEYSKVNGSAFPDKLMNPYSPGHYYVMSVSDNGIGFEQASAEKIFKVFTRLHPRSAYEGTGIGLSIVRKVAENHEGFVITKSEPGKGSQFQLFIPMN